MEIKLDPKKLWGRLKKFDNYNRTDIILKHGLIEGVVDKNKANYEASTKRLSYSMGLFYIFKYEGKSITLRFKYHHSNKDDFYMARSSIVDLQLLGKRKTDGIWIMLNRMHMTDKLFPNCAEQEYKITYNFTEDFDEFQLCLPYGSVYYYIFASTETPIKLIEPTTIQLGILGSSITSLVGTPACASIPSQLYRELKINSCTLAIPMTNSAIYDEILNTVKNTTIKWYLTDTMHMCQEALDRISKFNIKIACINARVFPKYKFENTNYIFNFDNPLYYRDHLHLTTFGAYAFIQALIPLIKEDLK